MRQITGISLRRRVAAVTVAALAVAGSVAAGGPAAAAPGTGVDRVAAHASTLPASAKAKAKLSTTVSTREIATRAGKYTTFKVTVRNTGKATATKVKVTMSGEKLKFAKKAVSYGSIKAGAAKTKSFKVRMAGSKTRTAKATATAAGKLRAAVNVKVLRIKKITRPKSLSGRYYWGFDSSMHTAWDNRAVKFVDTRWAYLGFPKKGTVTCSAKVKGCKRYTYNARTGVVKIGKTTGKVTSKQLTLGKKKYAPLVTPKKGTRLKVALIHQNFDGCFASLFCSTWTEKLFLDSNGTFVRTRLDLASLGVPGVSQTWYTGVKPDERGKYKILSKGRIQFRYANGKKVVRTIGIEQDVRGKAAPQTEGLLIGDVNFYPQD